MTPSFKYRDAEYFNYDSIYLFEGVFGVFECKVYFEKKKWWTKKNGINCNTIKCEKIIASLFRFSAISRFNFASDRAVYYLERTNNCKNGGGNPVNSWYATKFAQAIRIENYYKKEFTRSLNNQ